MSSDKKWKITAVCPTVWRAWPFDEKVGVVVEVMDSCGHTFSDKARNLCVETAIATVREARKWLTNLPQEILITVFADSNTVAETGDLGAAIAPGYIRWSANPSFPGGVERVILDRFRSALFHELHHVARGWVMYGYSSSLEVSLLDAIISEGLATAFEHEMTGIQPPWGQYPSEVESWVEELLVLPPSASYEEWMYEHPDGRRWIGYRAGTYIVEKAMSASGLSSGEMAGLSAKQVLEMAGIQHFA